MSLGLVSSNTLPMELMSAPQIAEDWKKAKKMPKKRTTVDSASAPTRTPYEFPSCMNQESFDRPN